MTTPTLSSVTLKTLENYRNAATQAVIAYRLGGNRLVRLVNGALQNSVYPRTAKLAKRASQRFNDVRGSVSEVIVKGVDQVAQRTEQAIEFSSASAAEQLFKFADYAASVDNRAVANGLQAAARLSLPGAKVALVVSSKLAQGANALADAAGASPVHSSAGSAAVSATRRAAPVARKVKAAVKTGAGRTTRLNKRAAA